jgi:hypothetical protein
VGGSVSGPSGLTVGLKVSGPSFMAEGIPKSMGAGEGAGIPIPIEGSVAGANVVSSSANEGLHKKKKEDTIHKTFTFTIIGLAISLLFL